MQDMQDMNTQTNSEHNTSGLPAHLKEALDRYVVTGIAPGHFLRACIENDLCGAIARADEENLDLLPQILTYLYHEVPAGCWGYKGAIDHWRCGLVSEEKSS